MFWYSNTYNYENQKNKHNTDNCISVVFRTVNYTVNFLLTFLLECPLSESKLRPLKTIFSNPADFERSVGNK